MNTQAALASSWNSGTAEARKLEYGCPPTPKPREEGTQTSIVPDPDSNFLEPTVFQNHGQENYPQVDLGFYPKDQMNHEIERQYSISYDHPNMVYEPYKLFGGS